ncbi:hypothetical protein V495_07690 [Pseudogymnoascus sp. VKM F-4514 (FW-929)]|nr:hypothetical protein V495_07690 [Pseudogymnoascus sp. VKM F-4514 (FW-929)]KFY58822.1 hypothetical protein V497_04643 [Pseudogymnoascus sp. VKM F-4516 (FW-969)]
MVLVFGKNELPVGSWDSHVHIVDEDKFPLHPDHPYRPKKASLNDLLAFEHKIGIDHVCLVAFSVYGTNNSSIIDALRRLNGRGRGVVCIDPDSITQDELLDMHSIGVRGVRLNLKTRSQKPNRATFLRILRKYADKIRPLGWVLQLYIGLNQIALIADELAMLGVPIVLDHLGSPAGDVPGRKQVGYAQLLRLLAERKVWIKMSGTYRFANLPDMELFARELLHTAPTQVVWASDWPHSGGVEMNPAGDRNKVQDYRSVSIPDFIARCKSWCDYDEHLMRGIWVDNPRRLWQTNAMSQSPGQRRSSPPKSRNHRRVPPNRGLTCSNCRNRKTRCDGTQPGCKTCEVYNDQCRYDKAPPMSQIVMMAKKLQDAEQLIARLQAAPRLGTNAADENLNASRPALISQEPSPHTYSNLSLSEQQSEATAATTTKTVLNSAQEKLSEMANSGGLISDLSLDENGNICYYGPTSAVHDPLTKESNNATDQQYDSPSTKSSVRSMLTSNAMESRAWENFAVRNAAFRSDIPQATMSNLLNLHWCWIAPMFIGQYFSEFLLVVLCAHAARFQEGSTGDLLISRARLLLGTEIHRPSSIPTVQALLQLSARDLAYGLISQAWLYSGMAFRMVSDLGLHHSSGKILDLGCLTAEDLEIRRRLFWSCYFWDKAISLYLGRMPTLTELPFDHVPELLDDSAEHELWSPYYGEPGGLSQVPPSPYQAKTSHAISCFENSCRLSVIISNIMTEFYCRRTPSNVDEAFRRIRATLDDWRANSPAHLVYKPEDLPIWSPPPHILAQNLLYYATIILLHRPFYSSTVHHTACRNAANSIERLLLLLETTFGFNKITYLMAYCIYTGASAMVQDVKSGELEAKVKMSTFLRALNGGLKTCPIVQRSIDIINNSLQGSQAWMPEIDNAAPDNSMRNYLPAFPYRDAQMDPSNESNYNFIDLDAFALLDSFPENHIDAVTGEWCLS